MMRTLGVEEELLLVDARSAVPVPLAQEVIAAAAASSPAFAVVSEMHQEMVELVSTPHSALTSLDGEVRAARRAADTWAEGLGARAVPMGTSPLAFEPHPSPGPRY